MKFIRYWWIGGSVVSSAVNHYPTYNVNYFFLEGITVMCELRLFYLYDLLPAPADLLLLTSECWDWHVGLSCRVELCTRSLMPPSCSEECWTSRISITAKVMFFKNIVLRVILILSWLRNVWLHFVISSFPVLLILSEGNSIGETPLYIVIFFWPY